MKGPGIKRRAYCGTGILPVNHGQDAYATSELAER